MRPTNPLRVFTALISAACLAACSGDGSSMSGASTAGGVEQIPVVVEPDPLYEYHTEGDPVEQQDSGSSDGGQDAPTIEHGGIEPADDEAPAPEPGTMVLLGGGLAALAAARRRKKKLG